MWRYTKNGPFDVAKKFIVRMLDIVVSGAVSKEVNVKDFRHFIGEIYFLIT